MVSPFAKQVFSRRGESRTGGKAAGSPKILFVSGGSRRETRKRKNLWIDAAARPSITKRQMLEKTPVKGGHAIRQRPRIVRDAMHHARRDHRHQRRRRSADLLPATDR